MSQRSEQKLITKEAKVLRYLRLKSGFSLNQAGRACRITGSAIAHIEQGRMDTSTKRIEVMVEAYGSTMDAFFEYMDGKDVPINYRDECRVLLLNIDESKLPLIHGMLTSLAK